MELNFKSILKKMKKEDQYSVIIENVNDITSLVILCSISIVNPTAAMVASISHSLLIKDKLTKIGQSLLEHFKDIEKSTTLFEIAYVLIHFSSFFDTLDEIFPDLLKNTKLSDIDKKFIIKRKLESAKQLIKDSDNFDEFDTSISNFELIKLSKSNLLNPKINLTQLYDLLIEGFIKFIQCLAIWDELDETQRDRLIGDINNIKENALIKFENQLITLSSEIEGFDKWLSRSEHKVLAQGQNDLQNNQIKIMDMMSSLNKGLNSTEFPQFFDKEIEKIKLRIDNKYLKIALEDIEMLEREYWDTLSSRQKYQLKSFEAELYLIRNEIDKGAELLIASYYCDKNAERALFNIALGHYLNKDINNAQKYTEEMLKQNPDNADANTINILITNSDVSTNELISKIPEDLLNVPKIAFHIAEFAKNKKEYEEAFKWYEIAIDNDHNNSYEMKAIYAKSLIIYVINNEIFYYSVQIPNDLIDKLNRALVLLRAAWKEVENSELNEMNVDWLSDIATIKHLLDESDEAIRILDKGLEISSENVLLLRNKGVVLLESGHTKESIQYLKKVLSDNPKSDIVFKLIYAYSQLKQFDEAVNNITKYLSQGIHQSDRIRAERSLFDLYYQIGERDKASETLKKYSSEIYKEIDQSRFHIYEKNYEESVKILDKLVSEKNKEFDSKDIFEIANGYYSSKDYNKASIYYEKVVDMDKYSPILFRFVDSLNNCSRKDEALTIIEKIRKSEGFIAEIINIEASILEEIGDLDKITEICEDGLSNNPDDYQLQLNLALYYIRQEEKEKIKSILQYPFVFDKLSLDQGFQLAYIFAENDRIEEAFNLIYELRRKFYDQEKTHLQYLRFFFSYDKLLSTKMKLINIEKVNNNCAVYINENSRKKIYVMDDREDTNLIRFKEIDTKHPLYLQLINKSIGDLLELEESPYSTKKITILDIMHKYTYAFNETLNNYNDFFPSGTGMFKISLNLPKNKTATKDDFAPIFKGADELKEKTNYFENLYKSNPIPISFISKQSGFHIFDVMFGFASNENIGIHCCIGDNSERQHALDKINYRKKIVLDMTSIFILHHLKLFEIINDQFDLAISQSTIDEIDVRLNKSKFSLGKDVISVGKIKDQYIKTEYSIEQSIKYYDTLNDLRKWLLKNCEIKTVEKRFEYNEEIINKLDNSIGKSSLDSIILSSYDNYILLSDDLRLRQLAISQFKIDCIWTQVLLMYLEKQDHISEDDYQIYLVDLVCMNYKHTFINHKTIIQATKLSQYNINYPFTKVITNLGGNFCDLISALRVVDQTIFEFYNVIVLELSRDTLIIKLLDSATKNRNASKFIHSLMIGISEKYKLHPIYRNYVLKLLKNWLEISFL